MSKKATKRAAEKAQSNDEKVFKIPPNRELAPEKRGPVAEKTTSAIGSEVLNEKIQLLVDGLNRKRNRDAETLSDFKKDIEKQASSAYVSVEQAIVAIYETNSKIIHEKMPELLAILERTAKLENELKQVKTSLSLLYSNEA